eukprot:3261569-Rhodomonas_salina.1
MATRRSLLLPLLCFFSASSFSARFVPRMVQVEYKKPPFKHRFYQECAFLLLTQGTCWQLSFSNSVVTARLDTQGFFCYAGTLSYAMPGTDLVHGATRMLSGTDLDTELAYGAGILLWFTVLIAGFGTEFFVAHSVL